MLIVLLVLGLAFVGAVVWIVFGTLAKVEGDQKKAEQNAEAILNKTFDGREDVSFPLNMRTLKYETVVLGAKKRGYKLTHEARNQYGPSMLIFEKVSPSLPD